ncbi:SusC/RagA family TonB-linked outer membrane protein [Desertivirga arenae]|uniref:SusC/RagA family TonB-linked outer membrane protein n=1 Tax=Desertivirga arenae TaxID=2810309 RepID=UPI001A963D3A|nr:TonB-dependent receptor [Pedobacter sp. SYSU D00823]
MDCSYLLNKKLFYAFLLLASLQYSDAAAKSGVRNTVGISQQVTITGTVLDPNGMTLPGVSVSVKNSKVATSTNNQGKFSITAKEGDVLVFKMVGFEAKEVTIGSEAALTIRLQESNTNLNEVVVVGYGTQKKRDLTAAISSVKTSDLVMSSGPEIGNMLKGKVPGLTIRQNSAQPGGGLDILVRGAGSINASNQPLFVVDGFPISDLQQPGSGNRYNGGTQSILNSFNPNDIESIEVLKDASATAIYGSRAANGVILITTKRGAEGKPKIDYMNNFSFQKYNNSFDVLPLNEWMQVRNEAKYEKWMWDNKVFPYGTETVASLASRSEPVVYPGNPYTQKAIDNVGEGTNWMDLVMRNGSTKQHNLTASGGTKSTRYLLSGNYYNQDGVVKNSGFKRYSFRANVDQEINKYLKLGVNMTASRIDNNNSQLGGDQFENSGVIRASIQQGPHIPALDENGNYPINPDLALQPNPYSLLTIADQGRIERMLLNSYVDITPFKGMVVKLKAGVDRGYSKRETYIPTTTVAGKLENGRASVSNLDKDDYLLEATANYSKVLGGHKIDLLGGVSQQKFINRFSSTGSTGFITDAFLWNNLGAGSNLQTPSSYGPENVIASYFGRVNYNYKSKYLLTFTLRTDGASVFARNNKWGTFPSAAVAWNVVEEPFFSGIKNVVSQLKLRLSYGQTGNAQINSNAFAAYSAFPAWLSGEETRQIGVALSRLENPDLKWETTTGANLGVDYSLFNGRVEGSFELFNNVISDLLDTKPLNSYQEVSSIIANVGKTRSRGVEFSINTRNIQRRNFSWRTMLNLSRYKDTWLERAPDWKPLVYQSEKDPIRARYTYIADGILQTGDPVPASQPGLMPGMIKIKDLDGYVRDANGNPAVDGNGRFLRTGSPDGIIDAADQRMEGTTDPSLMAGLTNILTYKNFSLNFDFNGLFGRKMADPNYVTYGFSAYGIEAQGYGGLRSIKDRWTPTNPSTTNPSSFWGFSPTGAVGDFFMQDAWFVRLQNVSLGYNLPTRLLKGVFSSARVHVDAQNLFVITPYKGVDPETDSYTAAYPNIRTYTVGLNLSF